MTRFSITVVMLTFVLCSSARAFEVDGFRSGMTVEEALRIAQKYDENAKVDPRWSGIYLTLYDDQKRTVARWMLSFCKNTLVGVGKSYPFRWKAAAEAVSMMKKRYGEGTFAPWISELVSSSSYQLFFTWEDDEDAVFILMSSTGIDEKSGEQGARKQDRKTGSIIERYSSKKGLKSCELDD